MGAYPWPSVKNGKVVISALRIFNFSLFVVLFRYEGIDAVKEALRSGLSCSNDEMAVKINLIAPPLYGEE